MLKRVEVEGYLEGFGFQKTTPDGGNPDDGWSYYIPDAEQRLQLEVTSIKGIRNTPRVRVTVEWLGDSEAQ